jgi:hypothetical protein
MKLMVKIVTIAIFIAVVILLHPSHGNFETNTTPTAVISPATPADPHQSASAGSASIDQPVAVNMPAPSPMETAPFGDEMNLIHSKLQKWLEAKKRGSEDDETQTMLDLQAMLTDTNAAEIIQSLSADELDTPFGFEAIRHWMDADPVRASDWFAARPDTTPDQTAAIAAGWAANSAGLQNYAAQLPDSAWKQSFLQEAGSQMSARDPAEAVKLAQQMTPGNEQTSLLQSIACNWVTSDPNAALDWITSVKDPSLQEQLVASAAQSYALTDPALAMKWVASMAESDAIVKDAMLNIIQTWIIKDPAGAANLVSQLPDGDTKLTAIDSVSKYWQQIDPNAATKWIQSLAKSPATSAN